ncbi:MULTISPECIES: recombinase family protein [unclassified Caballeronia]|uniref:recombinase family protein n=1 Tax=unclassified Caballeronia TaxID=2646786 RepID=UPI0020279955|nr:MULTISPECIES: recombinase family protein [unclassified Caballeronia]
MGREDGRVFAYCRVSTVEQDTAAQVAEIRRARDVQDKRIVCENISGAVPAAERPLFAKLMDRLEEGDTLIVTKLDRLGRNNIDVQQTVERLQQTGVHLLCLQLGAVDLTSPAGRLQLQMMAAFAEFERALIAERMTAGRIEAKAKGVKFGRKAVFDEATRAAIRAEFEADRNVSALARKYDTNRTMIQRICADLREGGAAE